MKRFQPSRRRALQSAVGLAVAPLVLGGRPALAQDYPSRPIRLVVEVTPGAAGDVYTRAMASQLAKLLGQPIVVDNQAGAGGSLAAGIVSRAAADGYTLLIGSASALILRPHLVRSNSVDLARELTPISGLWGSPSLVLTSTSLPVRSMKELIEYARANPDKVAFGTSGVGSGHHFTGEQMQQRTGIRLRHIPYKGGNENLLHLVSGELPMVIANASVAAPFLKSDKIRLLAVVEKRSAWFPDTLALPEVILGFSAMPNWQGLFGPARLPAPIVARLNTELQKALATPEVKQATRDTELMGESPEGFQARIEAQMASVRQIAKESNIRPE
ncbi:MAG TPA: tripartite tricarboxylate transporter substrate binding protein [Ramlibacter sp.]|nr:tripartite tricarboxylate transporter substrate binding protein [Ramlibacter sp.]